MIEFEGRWYEEDDAALAKEIGELAATAPDNALIYRVSQVRDGWRWFIDKGRLGSWVVRSDIFANGLDAALAGAKIWERHGFPSIDRGESGRGDENE